MVEIPTSVKVAICIATYKRPIGLQRLLGSLREQAFEKNHKPDLRIVIIDNDSTAPNKGYVDPLKDGFTIPLIYEVEPTRGIASARNHAVKLAGDVDFIAFIDDDEVASQFWLDTLLDVQNRFNADVVNGPVIPRFEQTVPSWIQKGRFFNRRRFPTGTKIKWANTGNVLFKIHWLHAVPGPFDENLNLTGGEDTLFTSQIYHLGAKMIWADEAITEEFNPPSRVSANWILRRAYRGGVMTSVTEKKLIPSLKVRMIRFIKSLMHILLGCLLLVPSLIFRGVAGFVRSLMYICLGLGEISGLFGRNYMEYEHTHGK